MKKIIISILVLISVQSFGQKQKYAERLNEDLTIDSFYFKHDIISDSVFAYSNDAFVAFRVNYYVQRNLPTPAVFSNYHLDDDGINRNSVPRLSSTIITSGTYTPTLFNTTNVAASGANTCGWIRINNVVYVTGTLSIDATAAASTLTELGVSLPVATNIVAAIQCSGTAASDNVASLSARIKGDAANDRATISFRATSSTNDTYSFTFSYSIQ